MVRLGWLVLLLWLAAAGPAEAQLSEFGPYLTVETGQHTALVNGLALLAGGAAVLSVSDDKTARVWSTDTLAPQTVLRPPVGPADDGKLYAVATGPRLIALGGAIPDGRRHFAVHFYCLPPSMRYCGAISGLAAVRALRFSPDGRYLAIGFEGGAGILVYDMANGTLLLADSHVRRGMAVTPAVGIDTGYQGDVTWLDFDSRNQLLVAADGGLRLYRTVHPPTAGEAAPLMAPRLAVRSAAFSPDGTRIAAGELNRSVVHLLDAATLRERAELHGAPGRDGALGVVAWSVDGRFLFAAGTYKDPLGNYLVRRWEQNGTSPLDAVAAGNTITALLPTAEGVISASADPAVARLDPAMHLVAIQRGRVIDFRNAGLSALGIARDGTMIELPGGEAQRRLRFDVEQRQIIAASAPSPGLTAPQDQGAGLIVTNWRNLRTPRLNGRPIPLEPTETAHAVAISPDGSGAAIGTDFYLRFETPGGERWRVPTPAPVWGVNVSGDGTLVLAALGDGTLRWYDAATHEERLGLFVDPAPPGPDGPRWVMWTPQGYFDHDHRSDNAPDGRNLIGYLVDSTDWKTTTFVQIGQMYATFFRPDLVDLSFRGRPADLQQITRQTASHGSVERVMSRGLPSAVTLLDVCGHDPRNQATGCPGDTASDDRKNPADAAGIALATSAEAVIVQYKIQGRDGGLGSALIRRNGAVIKPDIFVDEEDATSRTEEVTILLGTGDNDIQVVPVSASGEVQGTGSDIVRFKVERRAVARGAAQPSPSQPPPQTPREAATLYMLSVGISHYQQNALDLVNAAHDAEAVARLMDAPAAPAYTRPVVKTLLDANATAEHITAALKDIAAHAAPDDLVVIFLAGHGQQVNGKYYFAPAEFGTHDATLFHRAMDLGNGTPDHAVDTLFEKEGLGQDQLLPLVQSIAATHVALVLDTCFSAAIATQDAVLRRDINSTVANQIGNSVGRFVLSSSTNLALDTANAGAGSLPLDQQGHGLFTGYLLQALEGQADTLHTGRVDIDDLAKFTRQRVKQATASLAQPQEPTFYFNGNDFFALRGLAATP